MRSNGETRKFGNFTRSFGQQLSKASFKRSPQDKYPGGGPASATESTQRTETVSAPVDAPIANPPSVMGEQDPDTEFLRNLRGCSSIDEEDTSSGNDVATSNVMATSNADVDFLRNLNMGSHHAEKSGVAGSSGSKSMDSRTDADHDFLRAIHGATPTFTPSNSPKPIKSNPNSPSRPEQEKPVPINADTDFLANLRGANSASSPKKENTSALSSADTDFLANMRGIPTASATHSPICSRRKPEASPSNVSHSRQQDMRRGSGGRSKIGATNANEILEQSNASFLGMVQASGGRSDDAEPPGGHFGSLVLNTKPKKKRVQPPRQRIAHQKNSKALPSTHVDSNSSESENDFHFLTAVRESATSSFRPDSMGSHQYDSGTLVLNSPVKDSDTSFMMAFHESEDEDKSEISAPSKPATRDDAVGKASDVEVDDGEEEDDFEGLQYPSHPFMEKVLMPRPLFFGHELHPRIREEVVRVATSYSAETSRNETDTAAPQDAAEDDSSDVSSVSKHSVSSLLASGKRFEPSTAACCRNLEGAIDTFGFGSNPFVMAGSSRPEGDDDSEPKNPHPYVSLYSPVCEDFARYERAKARCKKAKKRNSPASAPTASQTSNQLHNKTTSRDLFDVAAMEANRDELTTDFDTPHQTSPVNTRDTANKSSTASSLDIGPKVTQDLSAADQFLRFARGGSANFAGADDSFIGLPAAIDDGVGSFIAKPNNTNKDTADGRAIPPAMNLGTFVKAVKSSDAVSDDDSLEAAEERKEVGYNDNLSAAVAMLAGEGADDEVDENQGVGSSLNTLVAAGGGAKSVNKFGRPYSNFELTNGCTPRYGCDDPSIPHESDLGVFETKDDEKRNVEERKERNMIENVLPGIMPHLACPTACTDIDDSQTWNSRTVETDVANRTSSNTILTSIGEDSIRDPAKFGRDQKLMYETSRIAWWNLPENYDESSSPTVSGGKRANPARPEVFPALDDPVPLDVQTGLWPQSKVLRENNISCARSHSATSTARLLPHLSDRAPSVRHLQIDTNAVGFPKLGGEVEPMFCKLAVYHFEMSSNLESLSTQDLPNMERCGRITETLAFDVVQDSTIIQNCRRALWPYADGSDPDGFFLNTNSDEIPSEGTSSGVFPLPAHLSISNLYAVIIVHKVFSTSSESHPYFKPTSGQDLEEVFDLQKLRENAANASQLYGQFITPFAFGVVPLKHIIGEESPKSPVSRAVQIPLFTYDPERGPRSILDHILAMLHRIPESDVKAAALTRGHVFLVMRYFGFHGLDSIIKKKSSLARSRLVDSSGELQMKCLENVDSPEDRCECPVLGESYTLRPRWTQYHVEPAPFGGRTISGVKAEYAKELASLPLERSVPETSRGRSKPNQKNKYDGLLFHTRFLNELICLPKSLDNCEKRNIILKIELREIQWNEKLNTLVAIPVKPSIFNPRRGPFLVQEVFTSCAAGAPRFLDEAKIKLPLVLGPKDRGRIGILISAYHISVKPKKRPFMLRRSDSGSDPSEPTAFPEYLGSGFLPFTMDQSPTCLLANGDHAVPVEFRLTHLSNLGNESPTPSHKRRFSFGHTPNKPIDQHDNSGEKSKAEEIARYPSGSMALSRLHFDDGDDNQEDEGEEGSLHSGTRSSGSNKDRSIMGNRSISTIGSKNESYLSRDCSEMVLQVTIVAMTSVHPQNKTLADLFLSKPNRPRSLKSHDFAAYSPWGKHRSETTHRLKPERIPPFNFVRGALAETERVLLEPVVSLTKSSRCPHSDLCSHLLRTVAQLWRMAVSGVGEPSILWASPQTLIPLRMNAFATLLHAVSSATHHMSKTGLRQLDGNSTWDITALGKVLSMVFDEQTIFGGPLEKPIIEERVTQSSASEALSPTSDIDGTKKPSLLLRSKTDQASFSTSAARPQIIERYSSVESPPKCAPKQFDVDAMLGLKSPTKPGPADVFQDNESKSQRVTRGAEASGNDQSTVAALPPSSLTSDAAGFNIDTKTDFMSALTASLDESDHGPLAQSLNDSRPVTGPAGNRRRWMTLPLAPIQEHDGVGFSANGSASQLNQTPSKAVASDMVLRHEERNTRSKQFRVPAKFQDNENNTEETADGLTSFLDSLSPPSTIEKEDEKGSSRKIADKQRSLPASNEEIESAGTAFLDQISKNLGIGGGRFESGGEERRVGAAHHRKTRSRCSIDWTLPPPDTSFEKDQQIEQINRNRADAPLSSSLPLSPIGSYPDDSDDSTSSKGNGVQSENNSVFPDGQRDGSGNIHPLKIGLQARSRASSEKVRTKTDLPDFADRISAMSDNGEQRWWPYVYEVILHQWVALLEEQTKKSDASTSKPEEEPTKNATGLSPIVVKYLSHAAKNARGATIRCAPFLLDIITQSLSWRVDVVYRERNNMQREAEELCSKYVVPPLVGLDETTIAAMEKLITMLTDASLDSRNFDSFEYRKISINVNDAVVRFLRNLFSILKAPIVHRLVMLYFGRFVTKEGKHWHDRDSKLTGLRCSWETTKLRLNAVTLFVRYPDFMTVNLPLMASIDSCPVGSSPDLARSYFSSILEQMDRLSLPEYASADGPVNKESLSIPRMKPHWLAEICTDICLRGTDHAEENIQLRSSSLLFELFWRHSLQGRAKGNMAVVASVFTTFIPKVIKNLDYLSSIPAKGQLRSDILLCAVFVLQSAPVGLMRALWRKLAKRSEGKTVNRKSVDKFGGIIGFSNGIEINTNGAFGSIDGSHTAEEFDAEEDPDIFDMFGLLNLSLSSFEYEQLNPREEDVDGAPLGCDENKTWRREFLLSIHAKTSERPSSRSHLPGGVRQGKQEDVNKINTSDSRRWHAHDCSSVIINTCRQIVREVLGMLKPDSGSAEAPQGSQSMSDLFLAPVSSIEEEENVEDSRVREQSTEPGRRFRKVKPETLTFSVTDTIVFVRAACSVYLHALTIRSSDIFVSKSLTASVEIVKIFGIKVFLSAVGETLQHWLRVILEYCGSRRAEVRVEACEFMNLLLRLTWDAYGSFTRIRLPLLAVQAEVMERVVSKASNKFVAEQKQLGLDPIPLPNDAAEAALSPLWRTIDRLHNKSASTNRSFKSALARLAIKMKKIYGAYIAAHALITVSRDNTGTDHQNADSTSAIPNQFVQRMRVTVHRIVTNTALFSRRFLGNHVSVIPDLSSIQTEAVEDAFVAAADVFSSTELPSHRVAWLQKLADFHHLRGRFAEEATCRCCIYHTYREAALQHDHVWSSSPFLPWASQKTHRTCEGHAIVPELDEAEYSSASGSKRQPERLSSSFRRIFYRSADSVRVRTGDWGEISGGKYLFYGVALKSEYSSVSPWYSHKVMEENMINEVELSGDLYLKAGIVESSRYAWSLANQFYSEAFDYAHLAYVYRRLAQVVTSQVPVIDVSNQLDMSSQLGRFYKVYFHGAAPDDLLHTQGSEGFIYRVPSKVTSKQFATNLEAAVRCILPNKTTIDLLLDDGSPTVMPNALGNKRQTVGIGGAPSEPVKIKVTPLRPLFKIEDNEKCFRGTPEWFQLKVEEGVNVNDDGSARNTGLGLTILHERSHSYSTNSVGSAGSMVSGHFRPQDHSSNYRRSRYQHIRDSTDRISAGGELIGLDKFYFSQPMKKDPQKGFRDWLKVPKGSIGRRSLRVTELQVENSFPACRTRQKIIHRAVFTQSPLEASVEAVSTWCSVLFRTVIATNGQGVLDGNHFQGLTNDSARLLIKCIHSSGVKQIGITFLAVCGQPEEDDAGYSPYDELYPDEIEKVQAKLARIIVTFLDLLHLLIARNRDVLLAIIQARKRRGAGDASTVASGSAYGGYTPATRASGMSPMKRYSDRYGERIDRNGGDRFHQSDRQNSEISSGIYSTPGSDIVGKSIHMSAVPNSSGDRTDSAIAVQSELQRGLISLVKALSPHLLDTINNEVPRWMRQCSQDNYFSAGHYRKAKIPIAEELFFRTKADRGVNSENSYINVPRSIVRTGTSRANSPNGSLCSGFSSGMRFSERPTSVASHRRNPSTNSWNSSRAF